MSDMKDRKYRIRFHDGIEGVLIYHQDEFEYAFEGLYPVMPDLAIGEEAKDDDLDTWVRTE